METGGIIQRKRTGWGEGGTMEERDGFVVEANKG